MATLLACVIVLIQCGCEKKTNLETETIPVTDQLGRTVAVPRKIERIAATHHFGGMIVYALGQQEKLVEQALYGRAAIAMSKIDPAFAARPKLLQGRAMNVEELVALRPQVVFVYPSRGGTNACPPRTWLSRPPEDKTFGGKVTQPFDFTQGLEPVERQMMP